MWRLEAGAGAGPHLGAGYEPPESAIDLATRIVRQGNA